MRKYILPIISSCLSSVFLMTLLACSTQPSLTYTITKTTAEYEIDKYSYLMIDGNMRFLQNNYKEKTDLGEKWMESFALPLVLIEKIENGYINEDSLLRHYLSVRSSDEKRLFLRDIIRIPEYRPSVFPQYNDITTLYMKQLLHTHFPNALTLFYKDILKINDNYLWDMQNLLELTECISSYCDKRNITGFLPIGEDIPELFPTWYVENIYQLASWYIFRINKHVVLWKSLSNKQHTILCLKFVDLQKTFAIIYPYREELVPFDSNGNPDLLLSPIALNILTAIFEPNGETMSSPYLALYIKKLQAQIRYAKKRNKEKEEKMLRDKYDVLFPYSLPEEYLSEAPLASVNYVYNKMNAARCFTLHEKTEITIFSSNQRCKYITKDGIKSDSTVIVDKCRIINEQTKQTIWTPTIDTNISTEIIKIERYDIILPPGTYLVRYEADRKHSFESWLSSTPIIDDYGTRIYKTLKRKKNEIT